MVCDATTRLQIQARTALQAEPINQEEVLQMSKIPGKYSLLSRLISLSAAGALIGSVGVYAADNQNATGQEKVDAPQFSEVDRNQDQRVVWTEIYAIYDDELSDAGWEEEDVMDRHDADRNDHLDENEYLVFVTALAAEPSTNLSAQSAQQSQPSTQQSSTQPSTQQQSMQDQSTQQDPSVAGTSQQQGSSDQQSGSTTQQSQQQMQQDSSMAGNQQEQGAESRDSSTAATDQQDSGIAGTTGQEDDEMAGTTGQQDPGTADYYDQQSQTSTGSVQGQQQGQGTEDQSVTQRDQSQGSAAQGQQQEQQQAGSTTTIIAITDIPDLTVEDLEDRKVVNLNGDEIGEVEQVIFGADGGVSGLVVGVGGFWDIGDKDVYANAAEIRVSGDQLVWETTLDEESLEELPEYETPEVSIIE